MTARPDGPDLSRHADEDQVLALIEEAREALDDLELGIRDRTSTKQPPPRGELTVKKLLQRARHGKRDGYPTTSGDRVEGGAASVTDEEGVPMPPVADPVGELVIAPLDPVRRGAKDVVRGIQGAVGDLRMAVNALAKAAPPTKPPTAEPGCASCRRVDQWTPVHKNARCRWCYSWWLEYHDDPPLPLLEAHHDGKRITTRLVKEVMAAGRL